MIFIFIKVAVSCNIVLIQINMQPELYMTSLTQDLQHRYRQELMLHHIETNQLISAANQLTGFHIMKH